jgi:peptide/nickel transport system substrate-binding protein
VAALVGLLGGLWGCGGGQQAGTTTDTVIIHSAVQPESFNPSNYGDAISGYIMDNLFQTLLLTDEKYPYPQSGQLAVGLPEVSTDGLAITFTIRPEAQWDNGTPITAQDVLFSLKLYRVPKIKSDRLRSYFEMVDDLTIDPANPKKFTFRLNKPDVEAVSSLGEALRVQPAYVYDPAGVLAKYSLRDLNDPKKNSAPELISFAEAYNGTKFMREPEGVVGSGPYQLEKWVTDQVVVLKRKANWWGDALQNEPNLQAYPKKLIYKIIKDETGALTELKSQKMDVMSSISGKDFRDFQKNDKFKEAYELSTPPTFAYSYFGMNLRPGDQRKPFFTQPEVRMAMAHIADPAAYNETVGQGLGQRVVGPVSPHHPAYNKELKPIPHDIEKAKQLLTDAGWKDSNGNGIRDKMINGKLVEFEFEFSINENEQRKKVALMFQQAAKEAGIKVELKSYDWTIYQDILKQKKFDMFYGGWIAGPQAYNQKQIWHSSSWSADGSNYVGFGDQVSDRLIEKIRVELDSTRRSDMLKEFQRIVYDQQPYIFLTSPLERIAIARKFSNIETSAIRPGFRARRFVAASGSAATATDGD